MTRARLATAWLGGCSGCHMSLLDLGERLMDLADAVQLVYGPLVDAGGFPPGVDVTLVEGAISSDEHRELLHQIRERSRIVVSLGDCAVTGNVTALRTPFGVDGLLTPVYGRSAAAGFPDPREVPLLLPRVLPLHHLVPVDVFVPGCPPDAATIGKVLESLLRGEPVTLGEQERKFG